MTFNSFDELKKYVISKSKTAISLAQEQVFQIINRFVKEYYAEFSPEMYERTYQFYRSLVKTDVMPTNNGWVAEVYFDISALDYHMKRINGVEVPNKGWSEMKTLESAMAGFHGGYAEGEPIWEHSVAILSQEAYHILKRMLIASGIPIK